MALSKVIRGHRKFKIYKEVFADRCTDQLTNRQTNNTPLILPLRPRNVTGLWFHKYFLHDVNIKKYIIFISINELRVIYTEEKVLLT